MSVSSARAAAHAARGAASRRIATAEDDDALVAACAAIAPVIVELEAVRTSPIDVAAAHADLVRTATARAVALRPEPGVEWFVLGSVGRRESLPSSDVETAAVIADGVEVGRVTAHGAAVHRLLGRCGLRPDPHHALVSQRRFVRTASDWAAAVRGWVSDPFDDSAVIMLSLLADATAVGGSASPFPVDVRAALSGDDRARRLMGREATREYPRLRLRDSLFRRVTTVDPKDTVISAIVSLARWVDLECADTPPDAERSTPARLSRAAASGGLREDDARTLARAFDQVQRIRITHQADRLRAGQPADDLLPVADTTPVTRSVLASAAREVTAVRRGLAIP
ncbi:putative nucleotidyltransferase substrate binding domain-containing protein [Rhodococcus kroppenstedtii]|uniref:putative nucleotidyltransferase substrate binding domain-containing protein n=1 Tax=Rhodococcoides kroppenstedtii TaxID=293050 RepID=UPI0029548E27|nr:putative nucleotidyltransferase substrate binding domain-containing protein [Rhodococcus kroppenstedtii]MDV7196736.1 putative nucleotidyltransferase substrate binding domain-containing protein [Rhodococcus kroppenstedtii]